MKSYMPKVADVLYALSLLMKKDNLSQLTMTIKREKSGGFFAGTVTIESSDDTETGTYSSEWQIT